MIQRFILDKIPLADSMIEFEDIKKGQVVFKFVNELLIGEVINIRDETVEIQITGYSYYRCTVFVNINNLYVLRLIEDSGTYKVYHEISKVDEVLAIDFDNVGKKISVIFNQDIFNVNFQYQIIWFPNLNKVKQLMQETSFLHDYRTIIDCYKAFTNSTLPTTNLAQLQLPLPNVQT